MSELNLEIENILVELSKDILSDNGIVAILNNPTEYPTEIIDKLSIETALRYWNGEIDFKAGDCIMNNIFSFWLTNVDYVKNHSYSPIAWDCYDAFDSGEYYRKEDEPNIDPAEKYTKPLIEAFLTDKNLIA